MNILILNWKDVKNLEAGGAEIIAFEFARRLVKDGHHVAFFCRQYADGVAEEVIDGVRIIRRGTRTSVYIHAFFYYRSLKKKPDLVIDMVNTLCWQTPLYVSRNNRLCYVNQLAKEVLFYEFSKPLSWISYFLERYEYMLYKNTRFVCYSRSTKTDLQSFGIPERNIELFPLGLDHKRYVPGKKKADYPLFVFVARLVRMKRATVCIDAMKIVLKEYPKAKLAIIGNGPEEDRIKEYIKRERLEKHIAVVQKNNFFIDKNIKDIKVKLMQGAWALLLPSVKEGWGMVVTEAAACGTPAIVSNVTGLKDSVIDGKTGIILSKDPKALELSDAMIQLIKNSSLRARLSKNAISWSKRFSWEKSYREFKRTVLLYEKKQKTSQ